MKAKKKPIAETSARGLRGRRDAAADGREDHRAGDALGRDQGGGCRRAGLQARCGGSDPMTILVLADVSQNSEGTKLGDVTAKALSAPLGPWAARCMCWSAGQNCGGAAARGGDARRRREGAGGRRCGLCPRVWPSRSPALLVALAPGYEAIVAPSTAVSKNVMPRVAALLDVMQVSDISKVVSVPIRSSGRSMPATRSRRCARATPSRSSRCGPRPSPAAPLGDAAAPIEPVGTPASDPGVSSFKSARRSRPRSGRS